MERLIPLERNQSRSETTNKNVFDRRDYDESACSVGLVKSQRLPNVTTDSTAAVVGSAIENAIQGFPKGSQ